MIIIIKNHPYEYDVENISEIFFPYEKIKVVEGDRDDTDPVTVITEIDGDELVIDATVYDRHKRLTQTADEKTDRQNALSVLLYNTLSEILDIKYPWGLLYGVRPARRMHALTNNFS